NVPARGFDSRLNCTTNAFHAGREGTSAPSGVVARRESSAPFDFTGRTSPQSRTESWKNHVNFVELSSKPQPREGLAGCFRGHAGRERLRLGPAPGLRSCTSSQARSGARTLMSLLSRVPDARPMSSRSVRVPQLTEHGSRVEQIGPFVSRAVPSADAAQ